MVPVPTGVHYDDNVAAAPSSTDKKYPKRCVVVGLGMVGIAFCEKLLKMDIDGGRDEWEVVVIGEEPHIAYNRVGLTQYFTSRDPEALYLNPLSWYTSHAPGKLQYHTADPVTSISHEAKEVRTSKGLTLKYDVCVLATGSDAALPPYVSQQRFHATAGTFVYRNLADLDAMIAYSEEHKVKRAAVIGGGLLGLEAAKALFDLETVEQAVIIERNQWVLSRQLDGEGGRMVLDKVRALGVEVVTQARVRDLIVGSQQEDDEGKERIKGLLLEGKGEDGADAPYELDMLVFAVGIKARDNLATQSNLKVAPRGGFDISDRLETSAKDVFAIGECASFKGETWGLIAPGVEMADVLAFNLTEGPHHASGLRSMTYPDLSCKLKLMGVDVASFGDFFADRGKLTKALPGNRKTGTGAHAKVPDGAPVVKALTYRDPFSDVYKKYIFTADGKHVVGGMMVGEVKDYVKLVGICNKGKELEVPPAQFILGSQKEGEEGDDLDDDTQICSCHNVTKGQVVDQVKQGCRSFGDIKSCTKLGTGCGGCVPLGTSIFNMAMTDAGAEISNNLCPHFKYSRPDMYMIIKHRKLQDFTTTMQEVGVKPDSLGCDVCRPAVGSILSSLNNQFIMKPSQRQTQDTNDRYLANIQRDGTYSVVPRLPAGEVTPFQLMVLGEVATEFNLYSKITGGQRIDLFGARKHQLPAIWTRLVDAGFESGHAYGKALRTVKSCVGTTWCRFGVGDSVGLAAELEGRYKSIRAPHKFKSGVSGCVRECAEAQSKDFGLIATTKGWNVFVAGNGGAKPRHAELIAEDVPRALAIKIIDRFLILYIRNADKLQRTARWVETLPGGINELKDIIVKDKLGICKDLEDEMDSLVGKYHCEWTEVVRNPERQKAFKQFINTEETQVHSERIEQRNQSRPADWPADATPLKFSVRDIAANEPWEWRPVAKVADLDPQPDAPTSAVVKYGDTQIAIWNIPNRGLRASQNMCPHRRAFVLADGLIGEDDSGKEFISCPLHKRRFNLDHKEENDAGKCNDADYSIMTFEARQEEDGTVSLRLPSSESLDALLSTTKWMLRKAREESHILSGGQPGQTDTEGYAMTEKHGQIVEIAGPTEAVQEESRKLDRERRGIPEPAQDTSEGGAKKASCADAAPGSKLDW
ncbi:nitrite reductase [Ceraceosorus bombacis]|uniref:Nitrite reductase [NAD(P)H] n=1 Tax=Ceraceosorus bombacis TaxID=401625 RepID=A0A0N7L9B4_9BASI|nr:nitrite reductase [Ceraceosorus bombacis]